MPRKPISQEGPRVTDESFMREAIIEASKAADLGEVPIGAVVVHDGRVIARAHNRRELDGDPSAHAEFSAIVQASRSLGRWRLPDCTVYVTLEPCPMCAGLMVNARVGRCVYGAADPKAGALGSLYQLNHDARLNHAFPVTAGVLRDECADILRDFFSRRRSTQAKAPGTAGDTAHAHAQARAEPPARPIAPVPNEPPAPNVLLAIDSYKGSATSAQAEDWAAEGVRHACPSVRITCLSIADGGEGTVEAVRSALGGELRQIDVAGPFGAPVRASYLLAGSTAVIEMASAAGLAMSARTPETAVRASSAGVGELVLDAVRNGARDIYVGLGGSCTNDGGAGFLQAVGAQLLDADGRPVAPGLAGLSALASVDVFPAMRTFAGVSLTALTDVSNPLVGRNGALAVFGPQKGLPPEEAADRDRDMIRYGRLLDEQRERSVLGVPGAGAAGGLGAAILALGGRLTSGIDAVLDLIGFDGAAAGVDLVITGEGRMDAQSARGKAPVGVARRAKRQHKPVIALVGGRARDLDAVYGAGIDMVIPIVREPMPLDAALAPDEARENLRCAGETAMRAYLLGGAGDPQPGASR